MKTRKNSASMVWRISETAPMGEWVDIRAAASKTQRPDAEQEVSVRSSYDLLDGIDIDEADATVPAELFDELFGAPPDTRANTKS